MNLLWLDVSALCLTLFIQAKGGNIAFLKGNTSDLPDGKPSQTLLAYINGDREYVLFDPYDKEAREVNMTRQDDLAALEETGSLTFLLVLCFNSGF